MTHELFRIVLEGATAGVVVIAWILREVTLRGHLKRIVKRMKPTDEEIAKIKSRQEKADIKKAYKLRKRALKIELKQVKKDE